MKIIIKSILIQNFKGINKKNIVFGDERTKISGANGVGKSSIFDAFTWCLFNHDSLGNTKFEIRPLTSEGEKIHNIDIFVKVKLEVNGDEFELSKRQKELWRKKRGTDTTEFQGNVNEFEINGYPKSEKEYKAFIAGIIDENIFNLVTNPNAFNALPWKEQREILMKFVGDFSDAEIAATYGDKFKALIPELRIASTDDILKKYTKAKNALNKQMVEIPARIDEASKQIVSVDIGALEVEKVAKQAALKKVEDELSGGSDTLEKINEYRQRVIEEKFKLSGLQNDANAELDDKRREARRKVDDADKKVMATERELSDAEYMKQDYIKARDRAESEKAQCGTEWKAWKAKTYPEYVPLDEYVEPFPLTEKDMICPTCGQELPEEVKKQRIADHEKISAKAKSDYDDRCEAHRMEYDTKKIMFSEEREKRMKEITVKGQKAADDVRAYQKRIDEQGEEISVLKLRLECEKDDLSKAKKNLADIPGSVDISNDEKYIQIQGTIQGLENEISELSKNTAGRTELEAKKVVLQDEISDIEAQIKAADNTKVKERIAELEEEQRSVGQKIAEQEQMIDLTEIFIRAKMNMISEKVNGRFKVVNFSLFQNQINGGLKETCECTVNGVPYSSLNNGHRIIAGLDIIRSLSDLYEVSAPVFIDNSEAISGGNFPEMDAQMIHLAVTDDKELIVESEDK